MNNTYKVIWSEKSVSGLRSIITYLEQNWSEKEIGKFIKRLDNQIQLITSYPFLFPSSPKSKKLRRSVLTKQTTIYYRVKPNVIEIISIFDTRQDPDKAF